MDLGLKGKVAIITGASKGLGRAIAEEFAKEGVHVSICARGKEDLEKAAAGLRQRGVTVVATQADVIPSGGRAFDAWINLTGVHLSFAGRAGELALPVLALWGDKDPVTPYRDGKVAVAGMPNARLVTFQGGGHSPFQEEPLAFARAVLDFLSAA